MKAIGPSVIPLGNDVNATVKCGNYGTVALWPHDITERDEVTCEQCGQSLRTYREIFDAVMDAAA